MKPLETTVEEVLRKAIQSECDTRAYYQKLAERAASADVRKRLLELAEVQLLHRAKLERKYREELGKDAPDPLPSKVEIPDDVTHLDMSHAVKLALEHERESESYFRFQAERVPNTELGALFWELAEIEWKHKTDLQAEYDASADPEQFLRDI